MKNNFYIILISLLFVSCVSVRSNNDYASRVTVGTVQKEIRKGMSAASVASVMGSPNIVTSGDNGTEVWIYDKISSNARYSTSAVYGSLLLIGGHVAESSSSSGSRTLTVIINFDTQNKVSSFKYHTSRF